MSENEADRNETVIETEEASAGSPESGRRRARAPGTLSPEELDEREAELRSKRRWGGPDLDEETKARGRAGEEVPDVPPTEAEEEPTEQS